MLPDDRNEVSSQQEAGAALLVIVAILAIIAALSIGTRYFGGSTRKVAQTMDTKQDEAKFEDAIAAFFVANSRLPCPADITITDPLNVLYGKEVRTAGGTPVCTTPYGAQVLPWVDLGLAETQARDPWGNYYSFHVLDSLADTGAINTTNFNASGDLIIDGLKIYAAYNSAAVITDKAIFVIISHGPNGDSAYTSAKSPKAASTDLDEQENVDANNATAANSHYVKSGTAGGKFDDILTYWVPN